MLSLQAVPWKGGMSQASASGSTEPHQTPEPAVTTRVSAGSSGITPVIETGQAN
jgi:hypothetical protein